MREASSVAGFIIVTAIFKREGKRFTAECRELGTATFGRTLQEAERKLKEAIELHLNTLEDVGERERFFREHNIPFYHEYPKDPFVPVVTYPDEFVKSHVQPVAFAGVR